MSPVTTKSCLKTFGSLGLALFTFASPARSQELENNDELVDLDEMVIVASRSETRIDQVGSTIEVLDDTVISRSQQPFLLDSLRTISGIYLRNSGGPGQSSGTTIRGLNSNRPTVLIDGIDVSNPANGTMINLGNLFGVGVDRVEVLKGPQSSLYGANALAGVISINTADGETDPGTFLNVGYGSFRTFSSSLSTRGASGDFSWSANASYFDSTGYSVQDPAYGDAWADRDGYENSQISVKFKYKSSDSTTWTFSAFRIDSWAEFDPGDPAWIWGEADHINYTEGEQTFARLSGELDFTDKWSSKVGASYSNVNDASKSGLTRELLTTYAYEGDRTRFDWTNDIEVSENWKIVAGYEYDLEDNRSDEGDRDNNSLFMENLVAVTPELDWTLGGRYDDNSVYGNHSTWRSTASYRLNSLHGRLRASYGTSFQAPSFFQLYSSYGDPDLSPEKGEGWDLGYDQAIYDGKLMLSATLFGNEVEDKIVYSYATYTYANEATYESIGLETALKWVMTDEVDVTFAHTYTEADYGDGIAAERVPRHMGSIDVHWEVIEDVFSLNTILQHVGTQFSTKGDASKQDAYTVVNLSGEYTYNDHTKIWARIDNLFDEDYQEITGYMTSGFAIYGGLKLKF